MKRTIQVLTVLLTLTAACTAQSEPVVVAVIDTGVDFTHPRLKDFRGESWDFVKDAPAELKGDRHGHGTHIAGIIVGSLSTRDVRLISLKYFDRGISGEAALRNSLRALRYAVDHKVDIINYSGGGVSSSREEQAILKEAAERGILVVAAAGNEASNSDRKPFFPANYRLPNILSVAAVNRNGQVLPSSNYGHAGVAIAALGQDVVSTMPGGGVGKMTGTSQATAFATRAAIQILATNRRQGGGAIAPEVLIEQILGAATIGRDLAGKTKFASSVDENRSRRFRNREVATVDAVAQLKAAWVRKLENGKVRSEAR